MFVLRRELAHTFEKTGLGAEVARHFHLDDPDIVLRHQSFELVKAVVGKREHGAPQRRRHAVRFKTR
jgi:hypothetical protein